MDTISMKRSFKNFGDLKEFLRDSGEDLELLVYPTLKFGAVYWIPNIDSGISEEGAHPWVIISDYQPGTPVVTACLRTSSSLHQKIKKGLYHPAGILDGLDRDGIILTSVRRPFNVKKFRDYRYEGQLPEEWQVKLRKLLRLGG